MSNISIVHPESRQRLLLAGEIGLVDSDGNTVFPFINGAYRLTDDQNYTDNFGKQWNKFKKTQLDKFSGTTHSEDRFFKETGWDRKDLDGKNVLEVGSGAGRFSQIVLDHTEAELYSVDYSTAVQANYNNNGPNDRLHLFQASIYELPFENESFDRVFCLGVLQHTPNVKQSVQSLVDMVKPGGELAVDFYPVNGWWTKIHAKYIFRPITRKMHHDKLLSLIEGNVDWMIAVASFFRNIGIGRIVNRFLPLVDLDTLPSELPNSDLREWCVMDTFDMLSPAFDQPQLLSTIENYFHEMGLKNVFSDMVEYRDGHFAAVVRGTK